MPELIDFNDDNNNDDNFDMNISLPILTSPSLPIVIVPPPIMVCLHLSLLNQNLSCKEFHLE